MTQVTNSGFQTIVNRQPAPGQPGDFYGVNPRAVVLSANVPAGVPGAGGAGGAGAAGQLVAPPGGLIVGNFAWADLTTGIVSQGYDGNGQLGFLHREEQAIIVTYLGIATYVVNQGFPITLFSQGDFWGEFAAGAAPGQNVYADPATGALIAGSSAPAAASFTASAGFTGTASFAATVMTVATVTAGGVSIGDAVTATGVTAGTTVTSFGTGTGGVGTYNLSAAATTESAEATTTTSTALHVTAVASGTVGAGDVLVGAGITTGTQITGQTAGTPGGVGIYTLSAAQNFAGEAVTTNAILTNFKVKSQCGNGEVAKISSWGT